MPKATRSVVRVQIPRAYSQPAQSAPIVIRNTMPGRMAGLKARGRAFLSRRRAAVHSRKDLMIGSAAAGAVAGFVEKQGMELPKVDFLGTEGTYGIAAAFLAPNTTFWNGVTCGLLAIGAKQLVTTQI